MKGAILDAIVVPSDGPKKRGEEEGDEMAGARKDAAKAAMKAMKANDAEAFADAVYLLFDLREDMGAPALDDFDED